MAKAKKSSIVQSRPTGAVYEGFDKAFEFFNRELFGAGLPPSIITMQRHPNSLAYFSGGRFIRSHGKGDQKPIDEIAMNPLHMDERTPEDILSTLVHEMAHSWQAHHGKEPTRCYHDRQWAAKMKEVGLQPSHTGKPGGKEVGPKMTHYIIEGGPFARVCAEYLKANETEFYQDRARALAAGKLKGKGKGGDDDGEGGEGDEEPVVKSVGRAKFTCLGCKLNAWARPGAKLRCDDCDRPLRLADTED